MRPCQKKPHTHRNKGKPSQSSAFPRCVSFSAGCEASSQGLSNQTVNTRPPPHPPPPLSTPTRRLHGAGRHLRNVGGGKNSSGGGLFIDDAFGTFPWRCQLRGPISPSPEGRRVTKRQPEESAARPSARLSPVPPTLPPLQLLGFSGQNQWSFCFVLGFFNKTPSVRLL